MPRRVFETTQLIEWKVHEYDDCEHVLEMEEDHMDEFEVDCHLVFRAPDDGRLWRIDFQINDGAGYNDFTGTSHGNDVRPERESFVGTEVEPRRKTVTRYEPVADGPGAPVTLAELRDLLALVMAKSGGGGGLFDVDLSDVPSDETLSRLTSDQREEVARWAATCHAEASDNDAVAGPCPDPLRALLPEDHPYKTWRVG